MSQVTAIAIAVRGTPIARPQPSYRLRPVAAPNNVPRMASPPVQIRKLKYHVSASLDGYVLETGRGTQGVATPSGDSTRYLESLHAYGIVLMGGNTYEAHMRAGDADPYPHLMSYVFSRNLKPAPGSSVEIVADDAAAWIRRLKTCPGKDLYLHGGAQLASSLFVAGLIDEIIVELNPVLQGSGRRLLSELAGDIALVRGNGVAYEDGTVRLTYRVRNGESRDDLR